jgi:hypothetical protein
LFDKIQRKTAQAAAIHQPEIRPRNRPSPSFRELPIQSRHRIKAKVAGSAKPKERGPITNLVGIEKARNRRKKNRSSQIRDSKK